MLRINTSKTWSERYYNRYIVFVIVPSNGKEKFKIFQIISLKQHKPAKPTFSCKKAIGKTKNRREGRHETDFYKTFVH